MTKQQAAAAVQTFRVLGVRADFSDDGGLWVVRVFNRWGFTDLRTTGEVAFAVAELAA